MPPLHGSWGGERVRESEEGERRTARSNTYIHSDTYCSFESYSLLERFLETISSLLSSRGEILRPSGHLRRTARRSGTWETSSSAHRRTLRRVASHRVTLTIPTMVVENIANVCRPATSNEDLILEASVERQSCRRHRCCRSSRESLREAIFYEYPFQEYAYIRIFIYLIFFVTSLPRRLENNK